MISGRNTRLDRPLRPDPGRKMLIDGVHAILFLAYDIAVYLNRINELRVFSGGSCQVDSGSKGFRRGRGFFEVDPV